MDTGLNDRPWCADSDSEGEDEGTCVEQSTTIRLVACASFTGWCGESESRNSCRVLNVSGGSSPGFLASDGNRPSYRLVAVCVGSEAWRRCGLMLAPVHCACVGGAPHMTQQGEILPAGQCQHDRKDGCSKHLASHDICAARLAP